MARASWHQRTILVLFQCKMKCTNAVVGARPRPSSPVSLRASERWKLTFRVAGWDQSCLRYRKPQRRHHAHIKLYDMVTPSLR